MNIAALGLESETWNALSAIASILGAIGTLAAVIVALWLALRENKSSLTVGCSLMQVMGDLPEMKKGTDIVSLTVTNSGMIPTTVKGVWLTMGFFRKQTFIRVPSNNSISTPLPKEITHSQQVSLNWPLSDQMKSTDTFIKYIQKHPLRSLVIRTWRMGVYTSLDYKKSAPVDKRLKDRLKQEYLKAKA